MLRWQAGTKVGDYVLETPLGRGGMGAVWRCRDTAGAPRALKALGEGLRDAAHQARFEREALALAALGNHPNLIPIHSAGVHEGVPWLVLGLAEGGTLEDRLQHGPLSADELRRLALGLIAALEHVHAAGVVHRDLKPANVLIAGDGRPLLTDFGIAHVSQATRLTVTGELMGTPAYLAPEQALGTSDGIGPWTDIYAFGALLYHALCGQRPFADSKGVNLIRRKLEEDPQPLSETVPGAPAWLLECVRQAMARRPQERPSLAELRRCFEDRRSPQRPLPQPWRLALAGSAAAMVGLLASVGVLAAGSHWTQAARERADQPPGGGISPAANLVDQAADDRAAARWFALADDRSQGPAAATAELVTASRAAARTPAGDPPGPFASWAKALAEQDWALARARAEAGLPESCERIATHLEHRHAGVENPYQAQMDQALLNVEGGGHQTTGIPALTLMPAAVETFAVAAEHLRDAQLPLLAEAVAEAGQREVVANAGPLLGVISGSNELRDQSLPRLLQDAAALRPDTARARFLVVMDRYRRLRLTEGKTRVAALLKQQESLPPDVEQAWRDDAARLGQALERLDDDDLLRLGAVATAYTGYLELRVLLRLDPANTLPPQALSRCVVAAKRVTRSYDDPSLADDDRALIRRLRLDPVAACHLAAWHELRAASEAGPQRALAAASAYQAKVLAPKYSPLQLASFAIQAAVLAGDLAAAQAEVRRARAASRAYRPDSDDPEPYLPLWECRRHLLAAVVKLWAEDLDNARRNLQAAKQRSSEVEAGGHPAVEDAMLGGLGIQLAAQLQLYDAINKAGTSKGSPLAKRLSELELLAEVSDDPNLPRATTPWLTVAGAMATMRAIDRGWRPWHEPERPPIYLGK